MNTRKSAFDGRRYVASGPNLTAPTARLSMREAVRRAQQRARFYGFGQVWRYHGTELQLVATVYPPGRNLR